MINNSITLHFWPDKSSLLNLKWFARTVFVTDAGAYLGFIKGGGGVCHVDVCTVFSEVKILLMSSECRARDKPTK